MENQHRAIAGYRELSEGEISAMNGLKEMERDALNLFDEVKTLAGYDPRYIAIATTNLEQAFMWAVRAIARPQRL